MVPEGWREVTLDDLTETAVTYGVVKPGDERTGGVPFIRGGDFPDGRIRTETLRTISAEISQTYKRTVLKGGEILVSLVGYPGATTIVPPELAGANIARQAALVRTNKKVVRDFLYQYLRSPLGQTQMLSQTIGSAQQVINLKDLKAVPIPLPPLAEQKRIAEVLGVWDRAILVAGKQLDLARTQKRALMQTLLTPTRRFPGYEGQPWKDIPFNEVFARIRRKNTVENENVLTISGQDGLVSQSDYFNKRVAAKDLSGYTLLHGGDFAYNKSYSNGYPMGAIKVLSDGQSGVVSSLYLCFHIKDETQHSRDFFRHYFEAGRHEQEISLIAQEGARNHGLLNVGVSDFFETYLHVPDYPEQCRIAEVIGAAEDAEQHAQTQITRLQAEKKALMQQLLTGQKRLAV